MNTNFRADLVLCVGTDLAFRAILSQLDPPPGNKTLVSTTRGTQTFLCGLFGVYPVALIKQPKTGINGSHKMLEESVKGWQPKAIFIFGTAYGLDRSLQKIGDVVVSKSLSMFEAIIDRVIPGETAVAGVHLVPRFDTMSTYAWSHKNHPSGEKAKVHLGDILSGPDVESFDAQLRQSFSYAIAGERSGVVCGALCNYSNVEWIVLHGISAFHGAEGNPTNDETALVAAVSLCKHVLSTDCLQGLIKN